MYGHGFRFSTVLFGAGFRNTTGIWQVSASGGVARLVIGTAAGGRHLAPRVVVSLDSATHFLPSPDGKTMATDPLQSLWMGQPDGRAGRTLPGRVPRLCVLSQYEWLSDGSGLAYVRICPDGQNGDHQATLFSVLLSRSAPRQLYRALSIDQQVVDLAPVFRCVACGG